MRNIILISDRSYLLSWSISFYLFQSASLLSSHFSLLLQNRHFYNCVQRNWIVTYCRFIQYINLIPHFIVRNKCKSLVLPLSLAHIPSLSYSISLYLYYNLSDKTNSQFVCLFFSIIQIPSLCYTLLFKDTFTLSVPHIRKKC